jgi:acetolactate synthase-1/2/3 large subunit
VEIPADVLGTDGGQPDLAGYIPFSHSGPDPRAVEAAARALRSARRPLILTGDGVLHAGATTALGELASALRAPVVTTVMGKGALPEDHPWSLGDSNSAAGSAAYPEHDLLLAVGARFVQVDTRWPWFFPPRRLVHLDADAREVGRVYAPEVGLVGDPKAGLEALAAALRTEAGERGGWDGTFPALKAQSDGREVHPILAALRSALPKEALTSFDVTLAGFLSRKDWFSYEPHGYFYPGVYVGMGFGLPVGIGAALARPDRPTCVVAGDGGFQMTMAELGTAAQYGIPLVVVVVNDAGLTLIRRVQDRDFAGRRCEVDLVNPDFTALAASYGIPAERVESPEALQEAVARAVQRRKLSFVEFRESG